MSKPARNDPCPCGSGKKFKKCCLQRVEIPFANGISTNSTLLPSFAGAGHKVLLREYLDNAIQEALAHHQAGRLSQAEAIYRQILRIDPEHPDALHMLGAVAHQLGRNALAVELIGRALNVKPDYVEAHYHLGKALAVLGQLNSAVESYRRALLLNPYYAEAHNDMGSALLDLGRIEEAIACYRKTLSIKPDFSVAFSNLLFLYGYQTSLNPQEYLSLARCWEIECVPAYERQLGSNKVFQRKSIAGRRLRVGYMSGDYHEHAVSYFIEQLFVHHDKTKIELFAYSINEMRDAVTERLLALVEHWIPVAGMTDTNILDQIESDGVDVLIDLSGHTAHNRLGVFARRAAPVQAYYLGYFASTGLTEMDYWIGDETLTPIETDSHFSEQVWRLPRISWSYDGRTNAPIPTWRPSLDGTVWVGSFSNLGKLSPPTLALWAKVLHALPEGKLLLKTPAFADPSSRKRIQEVMSDYGILPDRIELQDSSATPDWAAHMAYYNRLDVALDPVGTMGGVTTTCDALWMAVPVITMKGDRVASRATAAILDAIGHPEWITHSEAEYLGKVVALARDFENRKVLRSCLRDRMLSSPLCDGKGLAMALENAYFEMFTGWLDEKN